jgi:hypothetical protein
MQFDHNGDDSTNHNKQSGYDQSYKESMLGDINMSNPCDAILQQKQDINASEPNLNQNNDPPINVLPGTLFSESVNIFTEQVFTYIKSNEVAGLTSLLFS